MTRSEVLNLYPVIKAIKGEYLLHNYSGLVESEELPLNFNDKAIPYLIQDIFGKTYSVNQETESWYRSRLDELINEFEYTIDRILDDEELLSKIEILNVFKDELDNISSEYSYGSKLYTEKFSIKINPVYENNYTFIELNKIINHTQFEYLNRFQSILDRNIDLIEKTSEEYKLKRKDKIQFNLNVDELVALFILLLKSDIISSNTEKQKLVKLISNTMISKGAKNEISKSSLTNKMNKDLQELISVYNYLKNSIDKFIKNESRR